MIIRTVKREDMDSIFQLIKELAHFEKAPDQVKTTVEQLSKDCFDNKLFHAFVAEKDDKIVGMAITYYRYSTWNGKSMYLEDLYVLENHRGQGLGKALFDQCIAFAKETKCKQMNWQVLDWNEEAINFYGRYGTSFEHEWVNCSIPVRV
jgi:GNAT superfamily N-acetyltransferase